MQIAPSSLTQMSAVFQQTAAALDLRRSFIEALAVEVVRRAGQTGGACRIRLGHG